MVTIVQTQTEYEPSVSDRIQRVLYRLDHGEYLTTGYLRRNDNFCVLGLFADESGLGTWAPYSELGHSVNYMQVFDDRVHPSAISSLHRKIMDLYDMKSEMGAFRINTLPEELQDELMQHISGYGRTDLISLARINDKLCDWKGINQLLARIIRSGVIFNS